MNEILKVENLTKYYGNGNVVTKALNGIDFSVKEGDFTAIMGASGSGKSTLLNVIATIDTLSSGKILLEGENLAGKNEDELALFRRDKLGFIFQDYNLLDTLTGEENISLPLNLKGVSEGETRKATLKVAKILGVDSLLNKFPYQLSGGERQRVCCARALITNPALILADEPTGALDSANSKNLMETFAMMNDQGATILMVTHDGIVGSYAKRVLCLKDGKIWSEIFKGNRSRREMYGDILNAMAALGGEGNVQ